MTRRVARLLCLATVFAGCISCFADGDGSYCSSKDYLAFDMFEPKASGEISHVLKVVRFEAKRGVFFEGEVPIQISLAHHLTCAADRVEISGWGRVFQKYMIAVGGNTQPQVLDHAEDPSLHFDPAKHEPEPSRFDDKPAGPHALESSDSEHTYTLLLAASEKSVEGGVEHLTKAELVQSDLQGNVTQRVVLYENKFLETID
jgi:hypothetical protein